MTESEDRLVKLESKLAYLEDFMNKLQAIAVEHTEKIDRLKTENLALRGKLGELEEALPDIPNLRPPHY